MPTNCNELDFTARIRFPAVIASEYDEIEERRRGAHEAAPPRVGRRPSRLMGLALSGGGVRSATFNLGLLQALAAAGKLQSFDYLSTVSGGGYVGGWWSAWLSRKERDNEPGRVFPATEGIESERDDRRAQLEHQESRADFDRPQIKDSAINAGEDPIHHLRLFSNMMSPRTVFLSADSWRIVAVISRNILLLPILLAVIITGQAWFTLGGEQDLTARLARALAVPGLLFIGNVVCVFFLLLFSTRSQTFGDRWVSTMGTIAFLALTARMSVWLPGIYHRAWSLPSAGLRIRTNSRCTASTEPESSALTWVRPIRSATKRPTPTLPTLCLATTCSLRNFATRSAVRPTT